MDSSLWACNSSQPQDFGGCGESSSCGFVLHISKQAITITLSSFILQMTIHIHIQKVTPSSNSLSGSPHTSMGRGSSSALDSSANHKLPNLAPFLGASAMVQRLPELHMPALQMPRMETSSGEAIVQLGL